MSKHNDQHWRPDDNQAAAIKNMREYFGWSTQELHQRALGLLISQAAPLMKAGTFFAPPSEHDVESVLLVDMDAVYRKGKRDA